MIRAKRYAKRLTSDVHTPNPGVIREGNNDIAHCDSNYRLQFGMGNNLPTGESPAFRDPDLTVWVGERGADAVSFRCA